MLLVAWLHFLILDVPEGSLTDLVPSDLFISRSSAAPSTMPACTCSSLVTLSLAKVKALSKEKSWRF